jgi:hypothetical protein
MTDIFLEKIQKPHHTTHAVRTELIQQIADYIIVCVCVCVCVIKIPGISKFKEYFLFTLTSVNKTRKNIKAFKMPLPISESINLIALETI